MADINFKPNYGYAEPSQVFKIWAEGHSELDILHRVYPSKDSAQEAAASLAMSLPGETVYVLGALAAIKTDMSLLGQHFDPNRKAPMPVEEPAPTHSNVPMAVDADPEFAEVDEPAPSPAPDADAPAGHASVEF